MSSLQSKIVRKSASDPKAHRDLEKENLQFSTITAEKVVSEAFQMALTKMLVEAEEGKNSQKIMDTLRTLELDPGQESSPFDVTLWKSKLDSRTLRSQEDSYPQHQPTEKSQLFSTSSSSTLSRGGASLADATASSTGTSEDSRRTKPLSRSKATVRNKDQYVTRL